MKKVVNNIYLASNIKNVIDKTGIYGITFNFSKFYIGSASKITGLLPSERGFYCRWRKHISLLRKNKHYSKKLQNAFNKYGENQIRFIILKFCKPIECLKFEQNFIEKYNSYNNGYNGRPKASNNGGIKWSNTRKLLYQEKFKKQRYTLLNNILKLYNENKSMNSISKILGIGKNTILKIFKENNIQSKTIGYTRRKPIIQYDLYNMKIKKWESILQCSKELNINKNLIRLVLNGTYPQTKGFIFKYA